MMTVGRSMALIPDYSKGKAAALRIIQLNKRQSQINPNDESGIILVLLFKYALFSLKSIDLCYLERCCRQYRIS